MSDGMLSLLDNIRTAKAEIDRLRAENKAAWDSAEYNAQRARDAEKRIEELEAQFCTSCGRRIGSGFKLCPECWCEQEESGE